jgi:hypothetical protein
MPPSLDVLPLFEVLPAVLTALPAYRRYVTVVVGFALQPSRMVSAMQTHPARD